MLGLSAAPGYLRVDCNTGLVVCESHSVWKDGSGSSMCQTSKSFTEWWPSGCKNGQSMRQKRGIDSELSFYLEEPLAQIDCLWGFVTSLIFYMFFVNQLIKAV